MKILMVSTPLAWRGGEQQAAYLALALQQAGDEVVMLCPRDAALASKMEAARIRVLSFSRRGVLDTGLARKISSICKNEKFDLIHTHDSHAHSAAVMSVSFFGNPLPIVVSRRVDFPVSGTPFSKWKYNHPAVKKIICVSEMIRKITEPAIRDKSRLAVVHSGINVQAYAFSPEENALRKELAIPPGDKIIGNFSALADHKDYPLFIQTARALLEEHKSYHFVIAGKGPEEARIRQLIAERPAGRNIHLLGFRTDIPVLMKSLDLFLITSKTEGLGTIVLEAFAAGIPVVATRAGGIPELVEDGITGLLADTGDVEGLKKAVLRIFEDPGLQRRLVDNAGLKVKAFSYESTAAKTREIYREVCNS